jgi:hypothetical protein
MYGALNCRLCYNLTRYVEIYGSSDCTSEVPLLGAELELGGPERFSACFQMSLISVELVVDFTRFKD